MIKHPSVLALPLCLGLLGTAGAQTPPSPPELPSAYTGQPSTQEQSQQSSRSASPVTQRPDRTIVSIAAETSLTASGQVRARLGDLLTDERLKNYPLERVIVNGLSASAPAEQGRRVAIQWRSVALEDAPKEAAIATPLQTNLLARTPTIPPGTKITAQGDVNSLVVAIQKLFDEQDKDADDDKDRAGQNDRPPAASGGRSMNDVAASYAPLPPAPEQPDKEPDPLPVYGETTEGCTVRVDWAQGVVVEQAAITETLNGITKRGECQDTLNRFPIERSYAECADVVDVPALRAYPEYKPYYANGGTVHYLGTCQHDEDEFFALEADASGCSPVIDFAAGVVRETSELVYRNRHGMRVVAETCVPRSDSQTWPIGYTADGCSIRHDFTAGVSYQQQRAYYVRDDATYFLGACQDSETIYSHQLDEAACEVLVDFDNRMSFRQARTVITTPAGIQPISECQPHGDGVALIETVEGCETIHYDYPELAESRGASRWYHTMSASGTRTYVTACAESETIYPHKFEVVGYAHDDERRESKELLAVYIEMPSPVGRVDLYPGAVRPNSAVLPYLLDRIADTPAGPPQYSGCNRTQPTARSEIYKRPDGTEYAYAVGAGTPIGPTNACSLMPPDTAFVDAHVSGTINTTEYYWCRYRVRSAQRREDGPTIYGSWVTPAKEANGTGNYLMATRTRESNSDGGGGTYVWGNLANIGNPSSGIAHRRNVINSSEERYCYNKLNDGDAANLCSAVGCQ